MTAILVENVNVEFPIYGSTRSLRRVLFSRATGGLVEKGEGRHQSRLVVKALSNISFTLEEGDRIGLIGHNGSGKSTLLKVLAGIYEPVSGRVLAKGKIRPLFNMMPGMDGEDTGYQNIVTAGMLLGMSRTEAEAIIPQVEEFSELGEYLGLPVRTYSAGMTARLGFAVATATDPGILLMDEGLGAGDARFAERMKQRLDEFLGRSRVIVLATHSESLMRSICNRAALLHNGHLIKLGSVNEVMTTYHHMVHGKFKPDLPESA